MIKQVVKSEKELIKVLKKELRDPYACNNQHGNDTKEINQAVKNILKDDVPDSYPALVTGELEYRYRGFSIDLHSHIDYTTKEELLELISLFDD